MMRTLKDWMYAGGEWPDELEPVMRGGRRLARCTCGRVSGQSNFVDIAPPEVPVAQRLSGRARRARVRTIERSQMVEMARARLPEASPRFVCGWCFGAIRIEAGLTREQISEKVGHV